MGTFPLAGMVRLHAGLPPKPLKKRCPFQGKLRWPSEDEALKAWRLYDAGSVYRCKHCNFWHLTSQSG